MGVGQCNVFSCVLNSTLTMKVGNDWRRSRRLLCCLVRAKEDCLWNSDPLRVTILKRYIGIATSCIKDSVARILNTVLDYLEEVEGVLTIVAANNSAIDGVRFFDLGDYAVVFRAHCLPR